MTIGGKFGFPDHDGDTPNTMQVIYDYGTFSVLWEHSLETMRRPYDRDHGVAFIGNKETVVIDRGKWEVLPEVEQVRYLISAMSPQLGIGKDLDNHTRNFLDCIRSQQQPNCPAEAGRNVALHAHLGNSAYRTSQKIIWDSDKNETVGDASAAGIDENTLPFSLVTT